MEGLGGDGERVRAELRVGEVLPRGGGARREAHRLLRERDRLGQQLRPPRRRLVRRLGGPVGRVVGAAHRRGRELAQQLREVAKGRGVALGLQRAGEAAPRRLELVSRPVTLAEAVPGVEQRRVRLDRVGEQPLRLRRGAAVGGARGRLAAHVPDTRQLLDLAPVAARCSRLIRRDRRLRARAGGGHRLGGLLGAGGVERVVQRVRCVDAALRPAQRSHSCRLARVRLGARAKVGHREGVGSARDSPSTWHSAVARNGDPGVINPE